MCNDHRTFGTASEITRCATSAVRFALDQLGVFIGCVGYNADAEQNAVPFYALHNLVHRFLYVDRGRFYVHQFVNNSYCGITGTAGLSVIPVECCEHQGVRLS